jgi:5'-nucleotidase
LKLIITNDDGIDAPGIAALARAAADLGQQVVVAPELPQSGVGHLVTTREPILLCELGAGRFRVRGSPADCARIALSRLAPGAAWVLSGINEGGNLGADIYTSGTVAAAREAALLGCPAVALSQYIARGREVDWGAAARRAAAVLRLLVERPLEPGCFWNVNLPHPPDADADCPVVFCPLDPSPLEVRYRLEGEHLVYEGDYHARARLPGRDVEACLDGKVAITLLRLDLEKGPGGERVPTLRAQP